MSEARHGWVSPPGSAQPWSPGFGSSVPCGTCSPPVIARQRWQRFLPHVEQCDLPVEAADWTFASTEARWAKEAEKLRALRVLRRWAGGERNGNVNLYLHGDFGVGKSGLAICLYRDCVARQFPVMFLTARELFDGIKRTWNEKQERSESELLDVLRDVDVLILDDICAEQASPWRSDVLFTILQGRMHRQRATVYTSNLELSRVEEVVGRRVAERMAYRTLAVPMGGRNLRRDVATWQ